MGLGPVATQTNTNMEKEEEQKFLVEGNSSCSMDMPTLFPEAAFSFPNPCKLICMIYMHMQIYANTLKTREKAHFGV